MREREREGGVGCRVFNDNTPQSTVELNLSTIEGWLQQKDIRGFGGSTQQLSKAY